MRATPDGRARYELVDMAGRLCSVTVRWDLIDPALLDPVLTLAVEASAPGGLG